jgi:hypothetical protein
MDKGEHNREGDRVTVRELFTEVLIDIGEYFLFEVGDMSGMELGVRGIWEDNGVGVITGGDDSGARVDKVLDPEGLFVGH